MDIRFTGSAGAPDLSDPFWQSRACVADHFIERRLQPRPLQFRPDQERHYAAGKFTTTADAAGILLTFTPNHRPALRASRPSPALAPGSVTVHYTNTLAGVNYTLVYNTNLNNTANWYPAGTRTATGTSDFQTDSSATNSRRCYRVYYPSL